MTTPARPWLRFYGSVPARLDYPRVTLYEAVAATAARVPDAVAYDFFGTRATYRQLLASIERAAAALAAVGLNAGDRLLIAMPTAPAGVIAFYAANRIGALPALIHPLSAPPEILHYLDATGARVALTLDAFYGAFATLAPKRPLDAILLSRIGDDLSLLKRLGFWATKGRKIPRVPADPRVRWWKDLVRAAPADAPRAPSSTDDPAAILFSGGTTGTPKGIVLTNRNFIAQGMEAASWVGMGGADSILAVLPIFHGFGLGVCVNAAFMAGGTSILVPQFSPEIVAKLMRTARPTLVVGVPTLFDALAKDPSLAKADLSFVHACFSGADTLPRPVKERFEALVARGGGKARLLEGYGLTEAVTGIMATPLTEYREGSIGIPFPDIDAAICRPGTVDELPAGEEGEICIAGPAVMAGYLDDPAATAEALKVHADGRVWLHTGDLGRRDADGFFYFVVRAKRMIKTSGFNVYPAQVEAVLYAHPQIAEACVIGVPDEAQGERVKAVVVLRDPALEGDATAAAIIAFCRERLIKWSCPREVEFRRELPKTRVGKVDFKALAAQHRAAGELLQ
ncbi:MAG TPA: AMP-binding protein [Casimicrobiaceae bacterium]|nr:AMP-binding protein [Casimicrobiaceae bacterium]